MLARAVWAADEEPEACWDEAGWMGWCAAEAAPETGEATREESGVPEGEVAALLLSKRAGGTPRPYGLLYESSVVVCIEAPLTVPGNIDENSEYPE